MNYESLSHTRWACKYHVVFIPKYRKRKLYRAICRDLGEVFHRLSKEKESRIVEGRMMGDHVHMLIEIPPKYSVAQVIVYIKGKSAIYIARRYVRQKYLSGQHMWARGYFVSSVGLDEKVVRKYIREQTIEDIRQDELQLSL